MRFDPASTGIDLITGQVLPALRLFDNPILHETFAIAHLSNGFDVDRSKVKFAFQFTGHVKHDGTESEIARFQFGFIQFMAHSTLTCTYLGRTSKDGHVIVDLGQLIGKTPMLDARPPDKTILPFIISPGAVNEGGEVATTMGDHPVLSVRTRLTNTKTGAPNMLWRIEDRRKAVSIFSAKGPDGKFQHFAHVPWTLIYDFEFGIGDGDLMQVGDKSRFLTDAVARGAPGDTVLPGLAGLLSAMRPSPLANDVAKKALVDAFTADNKARSDNDGYPANAPAQFTFDLVPIHILPPVPG